MSTVEETPMDYPRFGVLNELMEIAKQIEATRAHELSLIATRLEIMQRGRAMNPPIHMALLAEASGVAEVTVRKALGPVRGR